MPTERKGPIVCPASLCGGGADLPENSLSLAIGPSGWAVIPTDGEFFQTVTRGPRSQQQTRHKVRFDDLLEIPSDCFIGRELAIDTVSLWMTHDAPLPAAGFSDDLFGKVCAGAWTVTSPPGSVPTSPVTTIVRRQAK